MSSFDEEQNSNIDYWQVLRNHWGIMLITLIMCVVTAFVITTLMDPVYSTFTKFQVRPDEFVTRDAKEGGVRRLANRNFFETQRLAIQSHETLKIADGWTPSEDGKSGVTTKDFTKDLGKDYDVAIERLSRMIDVEIEIGSDMFVITTYHKEKDQAQKLAERVRDAYEARRIGARRNISDNTDEKLEADLQKAFDLRQILRKDLEKSSRDSGLPYDAEDISHFENQAKRDYDEKISLRRSQQDEIKRYEQFANDFFKKTDEEVVSYLTTKGAIIEKPRVPVIYDQIQELKASRSARLIEGYGEEHPVVKNVDEQLLIRKDNLKNELTSTRAEVKNKLKEMINQKKVTEAAVKNLHDEHSDFREKYNKHKSILEEFHLARKNHVELIAQRKKLADSFDYYDSPIIKEHPAKLPTSPISPNVPLIMGIGSAAGLIFGFVIAFLIELMDTSVKTMEDVEKYLQVPVLAVVPQDVGLLHEQGGATPDAEAYRILRTNIEFNRKQAENNSFTVVSGGAGEGKSTTLLNLAYICAQGGYTTLVIDADLRRPRLHTYLGVENKVGLSNYLTTDASLENVVVKTSIENMFFMPSGILPQDAAGILNSRRMTEMVKDVKSRFDLVLVDSPPILGVSDASVISSEVDYTMIVIQHRKLPRKLLQRVKQAVENVGGNIIGVVLNNVDIQSDTEYQYYTSYYTYHSPAAIKEAAELAAHQGAAGANTANKNSAGSGSDDLY